MEPPVVTKDPLDSPGLADDVSLKAKEAVTARQETRLSEHDSKVLKRAVLKMDLMVIVPLSVLYTLVFVDRTNIGSAQLAGMGKQLNLKANQFNIALMLFYVPYILVEIPMMMLGKKVGFRYTIPALGLLTGVACMCTGFVHTADQLYGVRFALGLAEGGILPSISFFIARFYNRHQMTSRLGLFQGLVSLLGCVASLVASGILKIHHIGWLTSWRNIFFLEGLATCVIAFACFFLFVEHPGKAWYLKEDERGIVMHGLREGQPEGMVILDGLRKESVRYGMFNITTWLMAVIFFFINIAVQGVSVFLPLIVGNLFPQYTVVIKQALSTPPLIFGGIVKIATGYWSDKVNDRSSFMITLGLVGVIGFAIQVSHAANPAKYFACFLMIAGTQSFGSFSPAWLAVNIAPDAARSAAMGTLMTLGNIGGLVSAWTYVSTQAPEYTAGNVVNIVGLTIVSLMSLLIRLYLRRENKRRDAGHVTSLDGLSDQQIHLLGNRHPDFRYQM